MRTCTACSRDLPATTEHFQKRPSRIGLSAECWTCLRARWRRRVRPKKPRPQTFRDCAHCGSRFGPLDHLSRRFCSQSCKAESQRVAVRRPRRPPTIEARRAHGAVANAIKTGRLVRADHCAECGSSGHIEAAHADYARPLDVRWLCTSCHRKWDWAEPKGGVLAGA